MPVIFTDEEVENINKYQKSGKFHPLTCGNGHGALIATNKGLVCPKCDYLQTWAHGWIRSGKAFGRGVKDNGRNV